jgi:hypothetical protein
MFRKPCLFADIGIDPFCNTGKKDSERGEGVAFIDVLADF